MKNLVLDTSVAVQWIVKENHSANIDGLFRAGYSGKSSLHVPALWLWECGNALLSYCKAGWISLADIEDHLSALRYPKPKVDTLPSIATQKAITELALASKLSFYDATDALIGTSSFNYVSPDSAGALEWQGWHSSVPVSRLTYNGHAVATDSLRATVVPEPTTFVLLVAGLAALHTRRRSMPRRDG